MDNDFKNTKGLDFCEGLVVCACQTQPAAHLGVKDIKDHFSRLLSGLLKRPVTVEILDGEQYQWGLCEINPPISKDEINLINEYAGADKNDLFIQAGLHFPTSTLEQELAQKLISKILPFEACTSLADDDGVWLVGEPYGASPKGSVRTTESVQEPPKCSCGNATFTSHQKCYHDILVDGNNTFLEDKGVYESERPYGPYRCTACNKEYDELDVLSK